MLMVETIWFEMRCPDISHRRLRGKNWCPSFPTTYTCLFDTNENIFVESCNTSAGFTAPGEKYVFTGRRRNIECEPERYQPFSLWSNMSSQCVYEKSYCNDEGQIIHENGSTTEDRSCRCDCAKGYSYVSARNNTYCIPSQEECSCYKVNRESLNSDYHCITNKHQFTNHVILNSRNEDKGILKPNEEVPFEKHKVVRGKADILAFVLSILLMISGMFCIALFVVFTKWPTNTDAENNIKVVASIDLGTTSSGYASSTVKDPMNIRVNPEWFSGYRDLFSIKTPTCVLLREKDSDFQFIGMGYDAHTKYKEVLRHQESDYLFFENFKTILYNEEICEDMVVEDIQGRKVKATLIFTQILTELKKPILEYYKSTGISAEEILWVVTVPAILSNKAKDFMRKCTEKTGITTDRLVIALESEAVSVHFQYRFPQHKDTKYIVVDIGGGMVNIAAHEKLLNGDLKELCKFAGNSLGGTLVDKKFLNVFHKIIGNETMEAFRKDYPESYYDLLQDIKIIKEKISAKGHSVYFPIPLNSLNAVCEKNTGKEFLHLVNESEYKTLISVKDNKMYLEDSFVKALFKTVVSEIITGIEDVLKKLNSTEIDACVLVGGISLSEFVQSTLKASFKKINFFVFPTRIEAYIAVIKGAVLYGHRPKRITSRITQFTYGILSTPRFCNGKHDTRKLETIDGIDKCKDVFELLVEKNNSVEVGRPKTKIYEADGAETQIRIAVYITEKDNVLYVDEDGCKKFCDVMVHISEPSKKKRYIIVNFEFGSTEFQVTAFDKKTRKKFKTECFMK